MSTTNELEARVAELERIVADIQQAAVLRVERLTVGDQVEIGVFENVGGHPRAFIIQDKRGGPLATYPLALTQSEEDERQARRDIEADRRALLKRLRGADVDLRHALPHLRNATTHGGLTPNSGNAVRDAIPKVQKAADDLRRHLKCDEWAEGATCLASTDAYLAEACNILKKFEEMLAKNEEARRARLRPRRTRS